MKCKKKMPLAKNGKDRGFCTREAKHKQKHGNGTCNDCGTKLTKENSHTTTLEFGSGKCSKCLLEYNQKKYGHVPRIFQKPGSLHTFPLCGCSGILPKQHGTNNMFARSWGDGRCGKRGFLCRVSSILRGSQVKANKDGFEAINQDTPHSVIRQMMREKNCVLCRQPLKWAFGAGKTPHLHHDHDNGEPLGFAHSTCNPGAEAREIFRLKAEVKKLQQENQKLRGEVLPKAA